MSLLGDPVLLSQRDRLRSWIRQNPHLGFQMAALVAVLKASADAAFDDGLATADVARRLDAVGHYVVVETSNCRGLSREQASAELALCCTLDWQMDPAVIEAFRAIFVVDAQ